MLSPVRASTAAPKASAYFRKEVQLGEVLDGELLELEVWDWEQLELELEVRDWELLKLELEEVWELLKLKVCELLKVEVCELLKVEVWDDGVATAWLDGVYFKTSFYSPFTTTLTAKSLKVADQHTFFCFRANFEKGAF